MLRLLREAQSGKQCPAHSQCNNCKCELASYHDTDAVQVRLNHLVTAYPDLAKLYNIGQTVQGRNLTVIQISKGVHQVNKNKNSIISFLCIQLSSSRAWVSILDELSFRSFK